MIPAQPFMRRKEASTGARISAVSLSGSTGGLLSPEIGLKNPQFPRSSSRRARKHQSEDKKINGLFRLAVLGNGHPEAPANATHYKFDLKSEASFERWQKDNAAKNVKKIIDYFRESWRMHSRKRITALKNKRKNPTQPNSTPKNQMKNCKTLGTVIAACLALVTGAHAQTYDFLGTSSTDPTTASNYSVDATPFMAGGATANIGELDVNNGTHNNFVYTSADGTTTFTASADVRVGNDGVGGGELDVTGGNLSVSTAGPNTHDTLGYRSAGTIGVSGGSFTLGSNTNDLWLSNDASGTINVSGNGTFNLLDYLSVSRDGHNGTINVSGNGLFDAESTNGTVYGANNNTTGTTVINLSGSGIYEQTGTGSIALNSKFTVNFATASAAEFSLLGDSTATLDSYITAGDISIGGTTDMTLSDYQVIGASGATSNQGIIELAAAPEPTTWAMLLGGVLVLLGVQRLSRTRSV
jgi:hypothetical protein